MAPLKRLNARLEWRRSHLTPQEGRMPANDKAAAKDTVTVVLRGPDGNVKNEVKA